MIKDFPILEIDEVYHVGTMNKSCKRQDSMEGSGLSVSQCPEAWMSINKFTGGDIIELRKITGRFLDYLSLTEEQIQEIAFWGIVNQYIIPQKVYRVYSYVEEWDDEGYMEFLTLEKAQEETEGEESRLEECDGYIATEKMCIEVMGHPDSSSVLSLLSTIFADKILGLDGVWWNETYAPEHLSAPRGVIFNDRVSEWII